MNTWLCKLNGKGLYGVIEPNSGDWVFWVRAFLMGVGRSIKTGVCKHNKIIP